MTNGVRASLIPSGSLGLKMLLVCFLVLLMGVPLMFVESLVRDRQGRAQAVTGELSERAGGAQIVGGPMLLVPYARSETYSDNNGVSRERIVRGSFVVFAKTGSVEAVLRAGAEEERRRGIYRATGYAAETQISAEFAPLEALEGVDPAYRFDWSGAQVAMFVRDARAVRSAAVLQFADGGTAMLEPLADLSLAAPENYHESGGYVPPATLQAFAAPAPFNSAPENFSVRTTLTLGGAQAFSVGAFAQDTTVTISGDRRDASAQGYFQTSEAMEISENGFSATWRTPFIARGLEKAADMTRFNLSSVASRDMGVSFVAADDVYQGVVRAVRYAIMFIGIVFLGTLIFEALSGKKAHPAQYLLVGLAQCVFYLLLLSITEIIGFPSAFAIAAGSTVALLAFYAGASSRSLSVGLTALMGLGLLYGVMYVLMTIEDFAFFAGSVVAFLVIAGAMIATSRINWYGRGAPPAATPEKA
jgi:inner membrane protein